MKQSCTLTSYTSTHSHPNPSYFPSKVAPPTLEQIIYDYADWLEVGIQIVLHMFQITQLRLNYCHSH